MTIFGPDLSRQRHNDLANDFFSDLVDSGQHAADGAAYGLVRNWAVGDREVCLLQEAVPINLKQNVLVPGCRAVIIRSTLVLMRYLSRLWRNWL